MTAGTGYSAESTSVSPTASPLKQHRHKNNNCNIGKMGKGQRQVNIKKSYEKPGRRARFTQFHRNSARNNMLL